MDRESFVRRRLFGSVRDWIFEGHGAGGVGGEAADDPADAGSSWSSWIVLEDADALGALVGDRLASGFLQSLQGLACSRNVGLVVHCGCQDEEEEGEDEDDVESPAGGSWIGASSGRRSCRGSSGPQLSVLLAETADHIVDVCPLRSGPTRDAHGRLVFSSRGGGGGDDGTSSVYNYCLTDSKAVAVRIRQHHHRNPPRR
jgi:hypothetical protein